MPKISVAPRLRIVRHSLDGVWYGTFRREGDEWISEDAKRLRRWYGPSDLSGVASGTKIGADSWFTPPVDEVRLNINSLCGVYVVNPKGQANLDKVQVRDLPQ